jgi:hypothetical protein
MSLIQQQKHTPGAFLFHKQKWSERRDSNPRPSAWEADVLAN